MTWTIWICWILLGFLINKLIKKIFGKCSLYICMRSWFTVKNYPLTSWTCSSVFGFSIVGWFLVPPFLLHSSALPSSFCEVPHTFQGSTKVVKHQLLHQTLSPIHLSIWTSIHPSPSAQLRLSALAHTLLDYFAHHIPGDIVVTAQKRRVQIWPLLS